MHTTTRKALYATTAPAVLIAVFEDVTVTPLTVVELVEPFFIDHVAETVVFITEEGVVECPTDLWANGHLARLARTVGWTERVTRQPISLPKGMTVEAHGSPIWDQSPEATVLQSLIA